MFRKLLLVLLALMPTAAHAEWREATSKHFIVYSEGSEESLREAITRLEKYDFVLRFASNVTKPSSPVKLRIYLLHNLIQVERSIGSVGSGVAGYYTASARSPIAVGLRRDFSKIEGDMGAEQVLFHEYAHHLMYQYFPAAYPAWYSEGFAEFYSTLKILDGDVIEVGHASQHRYRSFINNDWLTLDRLLTAKSYDDVKDNIHLLYAQGWLLVHYAYSNKEREKQLRQYLASINSGRSYKEAMDSAFGPGARELNAELKKYSNQRRIEATRIPFKPIDVGPIQIRKLPPDENAFVEKEMLIGRGILARDAADFAGDVRAIAKRFPDSAYAASLVAETEALAGNHAAAAAAVERWLVLKPGAPRAMMMKGKLQVRALVQAKSTEQAAWAAARKILLDAHKSSPKDPMILEAYYDSFPAQGVLAPASGQNALFAAFDLVPQDGGIRYKLARDFEQRNLVEDAISIIKPAAFELHGSDNESEREKRRREQMEERYRMAGEEKRETAREMLARLEKKLAETKTASAATGQP